MGSREAVESEGIRKMWTRDFIVVSTKKNRRQGLELAIWNNFRGFWDIRKFLAVLYLALR